MRNGNRPWKSKFFITSSRFLPYLWGMETVSFSHFHIYHLIRSYRTYEEWKPERKGGDCMDKLGSYRTYEEWKHTDFRIGWVTTTNVLTVPMRNGNSLPSFSALSPKIRFLPYLWGMETENPKTCIPPRNSSYRTYEEWKLTKNQRVVCRYDLVLTVPMRNGNFKHNLSQSRRYPVLTVPMRNGNVRFMPPTTLVNLLVLTVPMRNGNSISTYVPNRSTQVLTVPMRNGNSMNCKNRFTLFASFLPYLWGMETLGDKPIHHIGNCSYRTYEEWKHECLLTLTEKWHIKKFNCRFMRVYDTKF